jgi:hypothetical protein
MRTSYCAWHFQEQLLIGPTLRLSRDWINSAPLSSAAFFPLCDSDFEINVRSLYNSLQAPREICERNVIPAQQNISFRVLNTRQQKSKTLQTREDNIKMSLNEMGCESRNFISQLRFVPLCATANTVVILRSPGQGRRILDQMLNHIEDNMQFRLQPEIRANDVRRSMSVCLSVNQLHSFSGAQNRFIWIQIVPCLTHVKAQFESK